MTDVMCPKVQLRRGQKPSHRIARRYSFGMEGSHPILYLGVTEQKRGQGLVPQPRGGG